MSKKRKWIIGIVVALALVIGVPAALFMSAFIGNAPLEDGKALGPAREVKISFVSAYVLDAGDGSLALIDAGADAKGEALLAAISGMGKKPDDVRAIFFTHGHSDHTAAAPVFPKADIYALEAERAIVEGTSVGHSPLANVRSPKPTGIHITKPLKDGDAVTIGKLTVRVFSIPGHTEGSAAYLAGGVLFLGDAANNKKGRVSGPPWIFSDDSKQGAASLRTLAGRVKDADPPVKFLAFAHSGSLEGSEVLGRLAEAQ